MIALQGVPVIREGVFEAQALTLFDQEAGLNAKAAGGRRGIAALVDVVGVQALAGQPHMLGLLIDKRAASGLSSCQVSSQPTTCTGRLLRSLASIGDVVDPPEPLLAPAPGLTRALVGQARF